MMPDPLFNWERFWVPRGSSLNLLESAYLPDPTSEWGKRLNPGVVPSAYFEDRPCVILLGDAAMGKSTAVMQVERQGMDARIRAIGAEPIRESLGRFFSDTLLVNDLFRSTPLSTLTDDVDHPVHLYLDDFDECLLRVSTLPNLLIHELKRLSPQSVQRNLRLRILCRTSVWPDGLTAKLHEFWRESGVDVFELAPLRLEDVRLAATESSIDPDVFVADVRRSGAEGFAARPLTLRGLLRRFGRGENLSASQTAIFEEACFELCAAFDRGEYGRGREGRLTPHDRLTIAARIAAAAMYSNREFMHRRWTTSEETSSDVVLRDLIGQEPAEGRSLVVGEVELEEVLQTGLFAGAGGDPNRLRWAHRTYAEFLAARYLVLRQLTLPQVRSMIVHPDDPDGRLVPALHETAAWLAGQRVDVFDDILVRDPAVLLSTDVVGIEPMFRARLVDALLHRYEAGELFEPDWSVRNRFRNLSHSGLGAQLAPWIRDSSKSPLARTMAIEIAEACREVTVLGDLVRTALDQNDDVRVRTFAAAAVAEYGDELAKMALVPLVAGGPDDPNDEIKGWALKATWPQHLSAAQLFDVMTPSRPNLAGSYFSFLVGSPIKHLQPADIPAALAWVERNLGHAELPYEIRGLLVDVLLMAANALENPAVAAAFAPVAWGHLSSQRRLFHEPLYDWVGENSQSPLTEADRRAVVTVLARSSIACQADVRDLAYANLVNPDDVPWLLEQVQVENDEVYRRLWARLVNSVLRADNQDHLATVRSASLTDRVLRSETGRWQDSEELARKTAEINQLMSRWEQQSVARAPLVNSRAPERVSRLLDEFEAGQLDAWWRLNLVLTLEPTGTHYGNEYEPDLTTLPGWHAADESTAYRIVEAALTYVREHLPEPVRWISSDIIFRPDWAGYRALHLVWRISPGRLNELDPEVWTRWAPVVVGFHTLQGTGDQAPQQALARIAYAHAPDEVVKTLLGLIRAADKSTRFDAEHELRKVAECWDDRLAAALRDLLADSEVSPQVAGMILTSLLVHGDVPAREVATAWVVGPPKEGIARARALEAAHALVVGARDLGWQSVWPAIEADLEFGELVLARLAWRDDFADETGERLSVPQLAALYALLERRYPESGDPDEPGMHEVTLREQMGRWRNGVLAQLARRGSVEAVEALRELAVAFPHLEKIRRALVRAAEMARDATWLPPTPREALALAETPELLLVRNAGQLLDAVVESLARLDHRLQDEESRAAIDLWSVVGRSTLRGVAKGVLSKLQGQLVQERPELKPYFKIENYWRQFRPDFKPVASPKNELLLSDYVKRHLDVDLARSGVVVNREVQNRKGDITDIRIQAFARDELSKFGDPLTVVVEVKGCWNRDLETAMAEQLAGRYLQPANLRHGLYLVGWFNVEVWDPNDGRRRQAAKVDRHVLLQQLDEQTQGLARRGLVVRTVILDASLPTDAVLEPPNGSRWEDE
jgi:hypothetical protein